MIATPDHARQNWPCPLSRTFATAPVNPLCRGDQCPMWRWVPLSVEGSGFKEAVAARLKEIGGGPLKHKEAVGWVTNNREKLGLPDMPETGFCGMAGKP